MTVAAENVAGESRNRAMTDWGEARRMRADWLRHGDRYTIHKDPRITDTDGWRTFSEDPRREKKLRLDDDVVVWVLVRKARAADLTIGDRYVTDDDGPLGWRKAVAVEHDRDGLKVHITLAPDVAVSTHHHDTGETVTTLEVRSDWHETLDRRARKCRHRR